MHHQSIHRILFLLFVVVSFASIVWTQSTRPISQQRRPHSNKPIKIDLAPDGRGRKAMSSSDRGERTNIGSYSGTTSAKVDEKKDPVPVISKLKKAGSF